MAETIEKRIAAWMPVGLRPHARAWVKRASRAWRRVRYFGRRRYCPVCDSHASKFLPYGVIPRPQAQCPFCGAMERHRLVWLFFQRKTGLFTHPRKKMLHIAPEAAYLPLLSHCAAIDYLSGDYAPGRAMVQMDITDIHYPDESFDVVYCSHVLEHVTEDRKAMRELQRVLKTGGWAVLQVPIYPEQTFEDASVTDPKERERVFGQWDHVRRYGPDYRMRLEQAGFDVRVFTVDDIASAHEVDVMAIPRTESVYFCSKA